MSTSVCPKCGHSGFEIEPEGVKNSFVSFQVIRCIKCHTVINFVNETLIDDIVKIKEKLGIRN